VVPAHHKGGLAEKLKGEEPVVKMMLGIVAFKETLAVSRRANLANL
jgi:hypothetical protein